MKITLFTSNHRRHNYFINLLSKYCDKLFVIQESTTLFVGKNKDLYKKDALVEKYFKKVKKAEKKIFDSKYINIKKNNISLLPIRYGDLNNMSLKYLKHFLNSDIYIIFGSSFIKGNLLRFLSKKKAVNIHMGISPFYKGADCNFWAMYDGNFDMVGATIHRLSKKLDAGDILFHANSEKHKNLFLYSMSTVKAAFYGIIKNIIKDKDKEHIPQKQIHKKTIRITKRKDFTSKVIKEFYKKKIKFNNEKNNFLLNKFILKRKDFFK